MTWSLSVFMNEYASGKPPFLACPLFLGARMRRLLKSKQRRVERQGLKLHFAVSPSSSVRINGVAKAVLSLIGARVGPPGTANHGKTDHVILGIEAIAAIVQDRYSVIRVGDVNPLAHDHLISSLFAFDSAIRNLGRHFGR